MYDRRQDNVPRDSERRKGPRRRELSRALGEAVVDWEKERAAREELERINAVLEKEKYTDSMTGLSNRRAFHEKFPELVAISEENSEPMALLWVDANDLHGLNKREGHAAGDTALKNIAERLKDTARGSDMVARLDGDEFGVVLTGYKFVEGVTQEELDQEILTMYRDALGASASVGIAVRQPGETAEQLFDRADASCSASKPFIERQSAT